MRGAGLVLLIFLCTGIFHCSRWALPEREAPLAVLRLQPQLSTVAVTDSQGNYALYQFSDGSKLLDVIKLTPDVLVENQLLESFHDQPVLSGENIKPIEIKEKSHHVERSWLSARHRILLQIPLHPDRMTPRDWETLPGIGQRLASAIEDDRQKNGDFNEFAALKRVKGIGRKKLEAWQEYFTEKIDREKK